MKTSYNNRSLCISKGNKASDYTLSNYTWRQTVRKIVKVVDDVYSADLSDWR